MSNVRGEAPREPRSDHASDDGRSSLVKAAAFFIGAILFIVLLKLLLGY